MNGRGSSPATAKPALTGGGGPSRPVRTVASTVALAPMAAASRASLPGSAARASASSRRLLRRERSKELLGRALVGLGEEHVERDRRGALVAQRVEQPGDGGARPRPLADRGQRGLVDVDDAHRQRRVVFLRGDALVGIEGDEAERLKREGVGDAERRRPGENDEDEQQVGPAGAERHPGGAPSGCRSATFTRNGPQLRKCSRPLPYRPYRSWPE
jgi:hypothetical protein